MARALRVGAVAGASLLVGWSALRTNPDACKLLSLEEATALVGSPVALKHTESSSSFSTCNYSAPSQNPLAISNHAEIHYWLLPDVDAAKAKFQKVVHPGPMEGTTITPVPKLGDEGDIKRTPNLNVNSVEFRRGTAIVTIGVSPIVSDTALISAGKKALSRL